MQEQSVLLAVSFPFTSSLEDAVPDISITDTAGAAKPKPTAEPAVRATLAPVPRLLPSPSTRLVSRSLSPRRAAAAATSADRRAKAVSLVTVSLTFNLLAFNRVTRLTPFRLLPVRLVRKVKGLLQHGLQPAVWNLQGLEQLGGGCEAVDLQQGGD
jgi:hypothetical protein